MEYNPRVAPNLLCLDLASPDDVRRLRGLLCGEYRLAALDEIFNVPRDDRASRALSVSTGYLFDLLTTAAPAGLDAQAAVVEAQYVDRDYNIAYSLHYARSFGDYPRKALRLHFFRDRVSLGALLAGGLSPDAYLGYSILLETQPGGVGRTVLSPAALEEGEIATCCPTAARFRANLAGVELRTVGLPFVQHDERTAACASAAVWIATSILAERYGHDTQVRAPAEITEIATAHSPLYAGRGSNPGLTTQQVSWALEQMGHTPVVHDVLDRELAIDTLVSYLDSGIPPLLGVGWSSGPRAGQHHALCALGYLFRRSHMPVHHRQNDSRRFSDWTAGLVVADDQVGPLVSLSLVDNSKSARPSIRPLRNTAVVEAHWSGIEDWYNCAQLHTIIAPLPPRHLLPADVAMLKGEQIIRVGLNTHSVAPPADPLYRTRLMRSNSLRSRAAGVPSSGGRRRAGGADESLAQMYRGSTYPRYVWVTELIDAGRLPAECTALATAVVDPTSTIHELDFVTLHIPGLFIRAPVNSVGRALRDAVRIPLDSTLAAVIE